jgi:hypothetical protein
VSTGGSGSIFDEDESKDRNIYALSEGDYDPILKKTIHTLIISSTDYIVYLDEDLYVEWHGVLPDLLGEDGEIINNVGLYETISMPLEGTSHLLPFRRLLGESVARLLDSDVKSAKGILDEAGNYLNARTSELARLWFLKSSATLSAAAVIVLFLMWGLKPYAIELLGNTVFEIGLGACFGAIGAFMSILSRTSKIKMEAGAGEWIHRIEAGARVLAGTVGAVFVSLLVKANVVLGLINTDDVRGLSYLLLLCFIAGFSERFVPGLINKIEKQTAEGIGD